MSEFQNSVDTAKANIEALKATNEKSDLEMMVPIVGGIMDKVSEGIADSEYAVQNISAEMPMMTELSQALNVVKHTLGKAFALNSARLEELNTPPE